MGSVLLLWPCPHSSPWLHRCNNQSSTSWRGTVDVCVSAVDTHSTPLPCSQQPTRRQLPVSLSGKSSKCLWMRSEWLFWLPLCSEARRELLCLHWSLALPLLPAGDERGNGWWKDAEGSQAVWWTVVEQGCCAGRSSRSSLEECCSSFLIQGSQLHHEASPGRDHCEVYALKKIKDINLI